MLTPLFGHEALIDGEECSEFTNNNFSGVPDPVWLMLTLASN